MENNQPVIIAVDAMGGDHAPDSVIAGIKLALDNILCRTFSWS